MIYEVIVTPRARKQLRRLPRQIAGRIRRAIDTLADDPRPPGCIMLKDRDAWRVRVGDYRIVYEIRDRQLLVTIVAVGHRREIYD